MASSQSSSAESSLSITSGITVCNSVVKTKPQEVLPPHGLPLQASPMQISNESIRVLAITEHKKPPWSQSGDEGVHQRSC